MVHQHSYAIQCHSRGMLGKTQESTRIKHSQNTQIKYNSEKGNNSVSHYVETIHKQMWSICVCVCVYVCVSMTE